MRLLIISLFLCLKAHCETQVFEAVAKYQGQLAYVERHVVLYEEQTPVKSSIEYFDPEGNRIGILRSDFTPSLSAPNYTFEDHRHRSSQGMRWRKGKVEMFSRDCPGAELVKTSLIKSSQIMIGGEGLVYFIKTHLQELIKGDGMDFKFLIPGRPQSYDFFVRPIINNAREAEFEIEMKSWFMRVLGPKLNLVYDLQNQRIKSFKGISQLRNTDGAMMSVDVEYLYKN